jgi:hypothetical protein
MADPLALSGYRKVYVPTSKASVVSVYTAAEVDRLLLNYMPAYVAQEIEGIDVESYFVENVIIANTMVTNVLTAQKGYIAELTVDQLDSSDKVARYKMLTTNPLRKAPVGFILISDQHIDFIDAQYIGDIEGVEQREQATTRNGDPVYWLDETMTGITEDVTDYPVWQFKYTEHVKLQIFHRYDSETGYYNPLFRLGAGNGVGDNATAEIEKKSDGLYLTYTATGAGSVSAGETVSLVLGDDGAIINGLTYLLDALNIATNSFQATYGEVNYNATLTKDLDGRITQINTGEKVIPITYNEV